MRYVLLDKITRLEPGRCLCGLKNVSISDDLVTKYAPGMSALPSTMTLEAMAQAAGLLAVATIEFRARPILAKVRRFIANGQARPGDQVIVRADLAAMHEQGCRVDATARIADTLLAEATIYLGFVPLERGSRARPDEQLRLAAADTYPEWFAVAPDSLEAPQ
jgi:3-hydroxyacyl-[acyl-carrier-protein] dehydratase